MNGIILFGGLLKSLILAGLAPNILSENADENKNSQKKCNAIGCKQNHSSHYCKYCKNSNSNHKSQNCPSLNKAQNPPQTQNLKCKVQGCPDNHDKHYCRSCKNLDSDHFRKDCPQNSKPSTQPETGINSNCIVPGCYERHQNHFCKVCKNKSSNHLASKCPYGITLYHGTKLEFAESILRTGFRPSSDGRMGPGVYFTDNHEIAEKIARRWKDKDKNCKQFAVLQVRLDHNDENVEEGTHPTWVNPWGKLIDGEFTEYCVQKQFVSRIKVINIHKYK